MISSRTTLLARPIASLIDMSPRMNRFIFVRCTSTLPPQRRWRRPGLSSKLHCNECHTTWSPDTGENLNELLAERGRYERDDVFFYHRLGGLGSQIQESASYGSKAVDKLEV